MPPDATLFDAGIARPHVLFYLGRNVEEIGDEVDENEDSKFKTTVKTVKGTATIEMNAIEILQLKWTLDLDPDAVIPEKELRGYYLVNSEDYESATPVMSSLLEEVFRETHSTNLSGEELI